MPGPDDAHGEDQWSGESTPPPPPPPPTGDDGGYWAGSSGAWSASGGAATAQGGDWGPRRAGIIPLHPMSLGDVLDTAFKLFRATAATAALTVAIVYGPLNLLLALPLLSPESMFQPGAEMPSGGQMALAGFGVLVSILVSPLVTGAVTWVAVRKEAGEDITWQEAYRAAGSRYLSLLGAVVLVFLLAVAAMIALAIPLVLLGLVLAPLAVILGIVAIIPLMLVLAALFYVVVPVILLEGAGAWEGLKRSARLLRPRLWPTVGIVVVAGILIGIVGTVLSMAFSLVGLALGPASYLADAVGGTVASLVTVPVTANVALLVYLDARIRHEGFDIQVMTADLARDR